MFTKDAFGRLLMSVGSCLLILSMAAYSHAGCNATECGGNPGDCDSTYAPGTPGHCGGACGVNSDAGYLTLCGGCRCEDKTEASQVPHCGCMY